MGTDVAVKHVDSFPYLDSVVTHDARSCKDIQQYIGQAYQSLQPFFLDRHLLLATKHC